MLLALAVVVASVGFRGRLHYYLNFEEVSSNANTPTEVFPLGVYLDFNIVKTYLATTNGCGAVSSNLPGAIGGIPQKNQPSIYHKPATRSSGILQVLLPARRSPPTALPRQATLSRGTSAPSKDTRTHASAETRTYARTHARTQTTQMIQYY